MSTKKRLENLETKINAITERKAPVFTIYMKTTDNEEQKVKQFCIENGLNETDVFTLIIIKE